MNHVDDRLTLEDFQRSIHPYSEAFNPAGFALPLKTFESLEAFNKALEAGELVPGHIGVVEAEKTRACFVRILRVRINEYSWRIERTDVFHFLEDQVVVRAMAMFMRSVAHDIRLRISETLAPHNNREGRIDPVSHLKQAWYALEACLGSNKPSSVAKTMIPCFADYNRSFVFPPHLLEDVAKSVLHKTTTITAEMARAGISQHHFHFITESALTNFMLPYMLPPNLRTKYDINKTREAFMVLEEDIRNEWEDSRMEWEDRRRA